MKQYKVVIAHPHQQHSFETAVGLKKGNFLYKYVTTVYYKKTNLTGVISFFLKGELKKKSFNRIDNRIDNYVSQFCEFEGLLKLFIMRTPKGEYFYKKIKYHLSDRFAKKVARYCIKENVDFVIVYDDTSPILGEILKKKNHKIKIIMDMSAPAIPYLKKTYEKDMKITPKFSKMLINERSMVFDKKLSQRAIREINVADYFMVASEFSKRSLEYCGITPNNIFKVVYGVNKEIFYPDPNIEYVDENLNVVFIGGTKQHKGLSYVLEAFKRLKNDKIFLTVIGVNNLSDEYLNENKNINFTGHIIRNDVASILRKSDVLVFPSLGDGFGLSVTEALASGCPVICSENTGAADLIVDNYNGFIIPPHDYISIVKYLKYMNENRLELESMKLNAIKSVDNISWDNYYEDIIKTLSTIIKREELEK